MHIAFISYEYPPETSGGGISTYIQQIALSLSERKIKVEVFCASFLKNETYQVNEFLTITKVLSNGRHDFQKLSPAVVLQRNSIAKFDLLEVPEFGGAATEIKKALPHIPLIVKLHTPYYLVKELNDKYYDQKFFRILKKKIGLGYNRKNDVEYLSILHADHILSPSVSLKEIVAKKWDIDPNKILISPNIYKASHSLINIPQKTDNNNVLYIGRLETRKGVYNLAKAISDIVERSPNIYFILLGKDSRGPFRERSMKKVLLKIIGPAITNVTFIDHVPLTEIPSFLEKVSICIFPSLWENFPNVCLEAMAAARGIIASKEGGMKDMLEDINGGILIDPNNVKEISENVITLLQNKDKMLQMGTAARNKIINYYGSELINEVVALYNSLIKR